MSALSTLANQLTGFKGCPKISLANALLQAARRLCLEGWVWREISTAIDVVAGQEAYTITPPVTNTSVVKIIAAWYCGREITPILPDTAFAKYGAAAFTLSGVPEHYCSTHVGVLDLYPVPSASLAGGLQVMAALTPTFDATDLPDWILQRYAEVLLAGARSVLFLQPGETWADGTLSQLWEDRFVKGVDAARLDASKGNNRSRRRVVSHFY